MTSELVQIDDTVTLFHTDNPVAVIPAAQAVAAPLAALIEQQQLFTLIGGKKHVRIEGWTLLGSMLGVFPVTEWTRELEDGWEARVEARTRAGEVVGAAEAECRRTEANWKDRDSYALRSMAQTRAASKALRLPLGFIMQLGGFEATPAEEMDGVRDAAPVSQHACPACGLLVADQRATATVTATSNPPQWKCLNPACVGGSEKKKGGGRWPWASWEEWPWGAEGARPAGADGKPDAVEVMYRAVVKRSGADRDTAEAMVFEAATELGVVWPDPSLGRETLRRILDTAVGGVAEPVGVVSVIPDAIRAYAAAPLGELVGATIAEQDARVDAVIAAADEAGLSDYPMFATPRDKAGWVEATTVLWNWARGITLGVKEG